MMKPINYLLVISLFMFAKVAFAQFETISIWPNGIPNSIEDAGYIESCDSLDGWFKCSEISNPRIDCYVVKGEKSTNSAVVIFPGGGYGVVAAGHEGEDVAKWFNSLGISAFVVKYRLPSDRIMSDKSVGPLQDAQEAMRIVRRNAEKWNINSNQIGVMGFSAGGHLASTISTHYNESVYNVIDAVGARPDFSLLIYPVVSMNIVITHEGSRINLLGNNPSEEQVKRFSNELQVDGNTPPAFMVHSMDDNVVPVENSINYAMAMKEYGVDCELHIYQHGGHGYGMGRSTDTESTWTIACEKWLIAQGFL